MVLKKRLYYGEFHDFQVPVVPRAPRSLRRRSSFTKSVEDSEICAFDLLAAVAGKLLQESESSASSTAAEGKDQISIHKEVTKREAIEGKSVRSECLDQGSCSESLFVSEPAIQERKIKSSLKGSPHSESNSALEHASVITSCDLFKKVGCDVKLEVSQGKNEFGNIHNKTLTGYDDYGEICHENLANGAEVQVEAIEKKTKNLTAITAGSLKDPVESCVNTHTVVNSHSNVQLPFYRDSIPNASFPRHRDNVKIGNRDDDENSIRCNHHSIKNRAFRAQSHAGYRRIKKMLTSRYRKVAPNYEISNTSGGVKPLYCNRKSVSLRDRYQGEAASKRRKLFYHSSRTAYVQEASISNSIEKTTNGDKRRSPAAFHRAAAGVTSSGIGHKASFQSKDTHVKFSIKSFKVPELYIEVPETATVGSLKMTVMEAITTILGGDLRVGVLLQGKKVRDDNRTLQQTGISQSGNLDTLGFMLEPSLAQASPSLVQKEHPFLLPCETLQQLLRSPDRSVMEPGFSNSTFDPAPTTNIDNSVEKNHSVVPFTADVSMSERVPDSKAVVVMPPKNAEPISMVPLNCKTKRSEISQRRTRRPFSVSEVEALVEAVEKLGTGRWRDVKMRAFDDANHRTYVDLKDKWKTLVHTASISPQQRRGEPVPQELLDRVLAAHAYWSQNQFKQHGKHQDESLQLSFSPM